MGTSGAILRRRSARTEKKATGRSWKNGCIAVVWGHDQPERIHRGRPGQGTGCVLANRGISEPVEILECEPLIVAPRNLTTDFTDGWG